MPPEHRIQGADRMTRAFNLYRDLLFAATGEPTNQQKIGLDFLEVLHDATDEQLEAIAALCRAHAELLASLICLDELARRWRMPKKEIKQLLKAGQLMAYKHPMLGWLFTEKEIAAFHERNTFLGNVRTHALRASSPARPSELPTGN